MMVDNFKNNLINAVVENYPYPHIHLKSVFGNSHKEIVEKFPDLSNYDSKKIENNNSHLSVRLNEIKQKNIVEFWNPLINFITSNEIFEIISNKFNIKEKKIFQDYNFGINTPVKHKSTVRGPHFDNTKVLYAGLIYMREKNDTTTGGNFRIFEKKVKNFSITSGRAVSDDQVRLFKEINYEPCSMILFKNSPVSVHAVSPRSISKFARKYITFNATTDLDFFKIQPKRNVLNKLKSLLKF